MPIQVFKFGAMAGVLNDIVAITLVEKCRMARGALRVTRTESR
jgi:hypothetical protein